MLTSPPPVRQMPGRWRIKYTDGGMDSHAEEEEDVAQGKLEVTVIRRINFIFSATETVTTENEELVNGAFPSLS